MHQGFTELFCVYNPVSGKNRMIQNAEGAGLLSARPTRRKRAPEAAHMAFFWFLASKDDYSVYLESRISILHERSNDFLLNLKSTPKLRIHMGENSAFGNFTDFKTCIRYFNLKWPKLEEFLIIWEGLVCFDPTPLVERIQMENM